MQQGPDVVGAKFVRTDGRTGVRNAYDKGLRMQPSDCHGVCLSLSV